MESEGGNVKLKAKLNYSQVVLAREISYHNKDGY
jgi:hypothetical protein